MCNVPDDVETWLQAAKAVLLAQGFKRDPKQFRKSGQMWGVIRQEPEDMQIHVRAFSDGRLESEVELSNKYVQHLWSHRRNAHQEVSAILEAAGLPTERVSETFVPITGSGDAKVMPGMRTRNSHAAGAALAVGVGLIVGKHLLMRVIMKRIPATKAIGPVRKLLGK